jgi:hypothetical protein
MIVTNCAPRVPHSGPLKSVIPAVFQRLLQPASLLKGESTNDYEQLRDCIIEEIEPQSGIEWLWTADLVDLS